MSIFTEHFETVFGVRQNIQALRNKVLELAIQGGLVEQDPNDEPSDKIMERVHAEKQQLIGNKEINKEKSLPKIEYEAPFTIPNSWEWARLGEIITIKSGNGLIKKNMEDGTIPVYGGNGITGYHSEPNIWKPTIIIGRVGFYCGSIHLTNGEAWVTDNAFITSFSEKEFDIHYMAILLRSMKLGEQSNSTAQPVVSGKSIYPLVVPIPPLAEQKRIASKVEYLMSEIDKLEHYLERKERLETALPQSVVSAIGKCHNEEELKVQLELVIEHFTEVFQTPESLQELRNVILKLGIQGKLVPQNPTDEPASELLKRIQAEKELLIKEKKIKKEKTLPEITVEEIPYDVPVGWKWVRLNEILDVRDGTHDTPKYVPEGIPLVTSKNLKNGEIDFSNVKYISESDHASIEKRSRVDDNDILFAMIGSIGNAVVVKKNNDFSIKNMALFKNHPNRKINMQYVKICLDAMEDNLKQQASGGVQSFLSLKYLRELLLPLPPSVEQVRIVRKIESLFAVIDKLEKEIQRKERIVKAMATV